MKKAKFLKDKKRIALFLSFLIIVSAGFYFLKPLVVKGSGCKDCNLVMISLSNVSAENMSLYGYERVTTPKLDKWAKDAVVFDNAYTQTSWTLPVGVSLFTSLFPYSHKVTDRENNNKLDENIKTLPQILKDNGYRTAAFTGGLDYSNKFNFMNGFQTFEEEDHTLEAYMVSSIGTSLQKGLDWLKKEPKKKSFLFVHGYDAHCPFDPPNEYEGKFAKKEGTTVNNGICYRGFKNSEVKDGNYEAYYFNGKPIKTELTPKDIDFLKDSYDEEIQSIDTKVSDFLDSLDKKTKEKTVVVIFSDHGEMFAKHGRFGRAGTIRGTLYDDVLHVPLIMKIPGEAGKRTKELAQTVDLMPTILDALNIEKPTNLQGKSLKPVIKDDKGVNDYVYSGSYYNITTAGFIPYTIKNRGESIRTKDFKLIHEIDLDNDEKTIIKESYELYDLKNDPEEQKNLFEEDKEKLAELKEGLAKWFELSSLFSSKEGKTDTPDDYKESIKKRGYW